MGGSSATLSIVLQLIDQATSALQGVSQQTKASLEDIQSKANEVRNTFGLLGGAIIGGLGVLAKTAADVDTAQSQLTTAINAGIDAATQDGGSTSVLAHQKALLQQQLDGVNARIDEYRKKLDSGSAASGGYAQTIATLTTKQQALGESLDHVNNQLALSGASSADIAEQFTRAAEANTRLGFTVTESEQSFTQLFRATDSVSESLRANSVAMDLARATGMDLTSSAKMVELAMEGNGRALKQFGINLKDGLSPGEALSVLQEKLAGTARDYVNTPWGQLDVAKAKNEELAATLGNALIPVLTRFLQVVTPIIQGIASWTQEHPKLTNFIILTIGAVGLLALGIAAVSSVISTAIAVFFAFSTAAGAVGAAITLLGGPITILIALIGLLLAYVITHWAQIRSETLSLIDDLQKAWKAFDTWWTNFWNGIFSTINAAWQKVESVVNSIKSAISSVTGAVSGVVNAAGGVVSNAVGGVVHAFASGGIVTSPTLALVGEAGPEAIIPLSAFAGGLSLAGAGGVGGGGANIVVNILGGNYLDSSGATMIANAIGKQVAQQLRLKNFT